MDQTVLESYWNNSINVFGVTSFLKFVPHTATVEHLQKIRVSIYENYTIFPIPGRR